MTAATSDIRLRPLTAADSLEALTALLHQSYASLAAQGWNFTAVDQPVSLTAKRVSVGQCIVAEQEHVPETVSGNAPGRWRLVGTVMVRGPYRPGVDAWSLDAPCFTEAGTAILSQLAVHPDCRGKGLGERLMDAAEDWARREGYTAVALDTAMPAMALRQRYERRGYALLGDVQWEGKTYRSVLMRKALGHAPQAGAGQA
ncbi:GNAT family N-acetyltransferase [Roseateles depolymerans]|uniref:Putative N-acetyltransferase n=1 Tax=Roseateles depolymerans TaxID=76731 RepID=A0A0U3E620_9BURK|nr:GNAT family N-acetyltransferase [Roseateles depolymerans]ALV08789.1 Putative N-acetyltransferase [Roseateles depolymerans]REG20981.1 acetyltransferase (GNAT) family protein [Roseateles depolymerans]